MQYVFLTLIYLIYFFIKSTKTLQFLQQNRYNRGNKFIKYINKHLKNTFFTVELLYIPLLILLWLFNKKYIYVFVIFYVFLSVYKLYVKKHEQKKQPLVYTKRIIRLYLTLIVIYGLALYLGYVLLSKDYFFIYMTLLWILIYFDSYVAIFANIMNTPEEKLVGLYFKKKAMNKLKKMENMKVIGITGSYGKTSSKNILSDILNIKYNAFPTPKNFNTPFGIMRTINEHIDKFNDFFIAEMGACKKGEIKELCDLCHPTYGILTKIGVAHLETFGSEETIQKTKFELIESLPKEGVGILNMDDPKQVSYQGKFKCSILWIAIDNKKADLYAHDIKLSSSGTTFKIHFKDENKDYEFTTKLLGRANIYNILAGVALGNYLNISKDQLVLAVKKVLPVEHRLQMKPYYDMHLIDDAYNANPDGCKMALDVLKMMDGKRIVISSGMIELGDLSDSLHLELGEYMSDKADEVILIGKEQTKMIYKGLIKNKFNEKNIHVLNNIKDAFSLLNKLKDKDTYVLLQSDLPDIFNEK